MDCMVAPSFPAFAAAFPASTGMFTLTRNRIDHLPVSGGLLLNRPTPATGDWPPRVNLSRWPVAKFTRCTARCPEIRSFLYDRGHASRNRQTGRCRALRGGNDSRHRRCGLRVLQKPILGTTGSEHWHRPDLRRLLLEIPQGPVNLARQRLFVLPSCGPHLHSLHGVGINAQAIE